MSLQTTDTESNRFIRCDRIAGAAAAAAATENQHQTTAVCCFQTTRGSHRIKPQAVAVSNQPQTKIRGMLQHGEKKNVEHFAN